MSQSETATETPEVVTEDVTAEVSEGSEEFGGELFSEENEGVTDDLLAATEDVVPAATEEETVVASEGETETPEVEVEATAEEVVEKPESEVPEEPVKPQEETAPEQQTPEDYQAQREGLIENLSKEVYALTDEEAEAFTLEPEKMLPKLASRLHVEVLEAAVSGVLSQMPRLLEGMLQQRTSVRETEDAFHTAWPKLKGQDAMVLQVAQVYNQHNPNATQEERIANIGKQTMLMLGLSIAPEGVADVTPEVPAVVPSAPAQPGGVGNLAPATPKQEENVFSVLAEEDID